MCPRLSMFTPEIERHLRSDDTSTRLLGAFLLWRRAVVTGLCLGAALCVLVVAIAVVS